MTKLKTMTLARSVGAVLSIIVAVVYTHFSWVQWSNWVTPSWDLGIFTQLAKAYAAFEQPIVSIKGHEFNLWGDHFHPILLVLGPVYKVFPSPFTLLVVQNLLVALSVYLLVVLAARFMHVVFALLLGVAYAFSFGIQEAVAVQFHEVAFALPLLVVSLGYLVRARAERNDALLARAALWAVPLALVKEDMGLTVAAIAVVGLGRSGWCHRAFDLLFPAQSSTVARRSFFFRVSDALSLLTQKRGVRTCAAVLLWGLVATFLSVTVILPFFNVGGVFDYTDSLDVAGAISDPLQGLLLMVYPWQKAVTLATLLLTGAILWVVSPLAVIALPTLIWRFLATNEGYYSTDWHYSMVLMPIVFCALIDVLARFAPETAEDPSVKKLPAHLLQARASARGLADKTYRTAIALLSVALPTFALIVALAHMPQLPLATQLTHDYSSASWQENLAQKKQALASIPQGTSVASDLSLLTHLTVNHEAYWIGNTSDPAPDYVVIDQENSAWGNNPIENPPQFAADTYQAPYTLHTQQGSIYVMKRM
ncbi:DUF2079 domain-containing protein [Rothia sp. ZJ1223]|uniref:DUF2079 domain-containing protein n=1 Tax=Rothia sp. ZJ1223 TaxID=2811098 RepID=UPI00195B4F94|nr:DUF2079 domain-containing protein [Rothia sp. ZJ1223]MBM7051899.1 DUF2079 domain-containing protein [Rothia sp. ZJ1223]